MPNSPRGTPEMSSSQALKEENHNEAIRRTEAGACHFPVADRLTTPPGSCADGANYIITATATGLWTGKEGQIATAVGANASNGWYYHVPIEGFTAYVQDENTRYLHDGAAWGIDTTGGAGVDNDTALASDSTTLPPSVHAVRGFVASQLIGLLEYKGGTDCSANPNYPAASKGDAYVVTVAGKIGGGSGVSVDAGDWYIAKADNAGGTEASVGSNWTTLEHNGVFGGGGGSTTFAALTDAPGSLSGHAFEVPIVNPAETALEYIKTKDIGPDPAREWFGPSGVVIETFTSQAGGDPQLLWDGTQWVMIYWKSVSGSPYVRCYYRTAPTLVGTWSSATEFTALAGYHKPFVLVDEYGAPVQIGGNYHMYAVYYVGGAIANKEIYHWTCSTLTGTWTIGSKVIAKSATSTDKDAYNTDTPFALYKGGTVYLWYMGAPTSSVTDYATYGYAIRMLRATATNADGPFTKSTSDVLTPNGSAAWDYGWLGGVQVFRRDGGGYMMVYNAGDTRPSTPGDEPNTSRVGYAYADSLDGPWVKDAANPYFTPTGWPANQPEATNIWRTYLAFDKALSNWFAFYNTASVGTGGEKITYGIAGVYDYFDQTGGSPYDILAITTSLQVITNSGVPVTPGPYRVRYAFNVGDLGTTKPAIDVDVAMRLDATNVKPASREFIGSYNYENRDVILEYMVVVKQTGRLDATVQCTSGTPTAASKIRRGRVTVERIKAL